MKTGTKVTVVALAVLLLFLAALAGTGFYYYAHPPMVKELVERSLSLAMGAPVTIRSLAYGLEPFHVSVEGIAVEPGPGGNGFHLEIHSLHADGSLDGAFGQKRLTVHHLDINAISCRIDSETSFSGMVKGSRQPSVIASVFKRAFAFLIFRDIRLEDATLANGTVIARRKDPSLRLEQIEGRLTSDQRVAISCRAQLEWPSQRLLVTAPRVRIQTDGAISLTNPRIGCDISLENVSLESPLTVFENLQAGLRLSYRSDTDETTFEDMHLTLQTAAIQQDGANHRVRLELAVKGGGTYQVKDRRLISGPILLTMGDRFLLEGQLDAALSDQKRIDLRIAECRVIPQEMVPLVPPDIRKKIDPIQLEGPLHLGGRIEGFQDETGWVWKPDMEVRLDRNSFAVAAGSMRLGGKLNGRIRAGGTMPEVEMSGDLKAQAVVVRGSGLEAGPSEAAISFSGTYPVFALKKLSLRIPRVTTVFRDKPIRMNDIHLEAGMANLNVATRSVSFRNVRLDTSLLSNITASIEGADGRIREVEIQGTDTGWASLAGGLGFLPSGWELAGRDTLKARIRFEKGDGATLASEWTLRDVGFQEPKGELVAEKVSLKATLNGNRDPLGQMITADIDVNASNGEVLYDRFYVDMGRHPLSFVFRGTYHVTGKTATVSNLKLGLRHLMTIHLNGRGAEEGSGWKWDLNANVPEVRLGPLFDFLVVEPFQAEKPSVKGIRVDGTVSSSVRLTGGPSHWAAKGSVLWRKGDVSAEAIGVSLKEIDLSLPVWLQGPESESPAKGLAGRLSIGSAGIPFIPKQKLAVDLEAEPNRLSIPSPTVVKIPGGDIRLGPVRIEGLSRSMPSIRTDLTMDGMALDGLLGGLWPRPVDGTLKGKLDPVQIEGGRITTSEEITATVFGGQIRLSRIGVDGIPGRTPVFKLDARWKELDLSQITADTPFGKVEGLLSGYAKGLEIADGQVQKFDLMMETVRKEGIPQRISVRAVDNIAQIGGGRSPFVGVAGLFASAFKEFPYEKIGVRATLENDVFRINGTVREDGTEYLVKRGLLSGVNVVNQNPDNQVSFKDMIKRIRRIQTSRGGPVIQ